MSSATKKEVGLHVDAETVEKALRLFHSGSLFEIRAIRGREVIAGFFDCPAAAAKARVYCFLR